MSFIQCDPVTKHKNSRVLAGRFQVGTPAVAQMMDSCSKAKFHFGVIRYVGPPTNSPTDQDLVVCLDLELDAKPTQRDLWCNGIFFGVRRHPLMVSRSMFFSPLAVKPLSLGTLSKLPMEIITIIAQYSAKTSTQSPAECVTKMVIQNQLYKHVKKNVCVPSKKWKKKELSTAAWYQKYLHLEANSNFLKGISLKCYSLHQASKAPTSLENDFLGDHLQTILLADSFHPKFYAEKLPSKLNQKCLKLRPVEALKSSPSQAWCDFIQSIYTPDEKLQLDFVDQFAPYDFVHREDVFQFSALAAAVHAKANIEILKALVKGGSYVVATSLPSSVNPLHLACAANDQEMCDVLTAGNPGLYFVPLDVDRCAFYHALELKHYDLVKHIIHQVPEVLEHFAEELELAGLGALAYPTLWKTVLKESASVRLVWNREEWGTLLHMLAGEKGDSIKEFAELFSFAPSAIHTAVDCQGRTLLHLAVSADNDGITEFLLENEPSMASVPATDGNIPLQYALRRPRVKSKTIQLLREKLNKSPSEYKDIDGIMTSVCQAQGASFAQELLQLLQCDTPSIDLISAVCRLRNALSTVIEPFFSRFPKAAVTPLTDRPTPRVTNYCNYYALDIAVVSGNVEVTLFLMKNFANVFADNDEVEKESYALQFFCRLLDSGNETLISTLLKTVQTFHFCSEGFLQMAFWEKSPSLFLQFMKPRVAEDWHLKSPNSVVSMLTFFQDDEETLDVIVPLLQELFSVEEMFFVMFCTLTSGGSRHPWKHYNTPLNDLFVQLVEEKADQIGQQKEYNLLNEIASVFTKAQNIQWSKEWRSFFDACLAQCPYDPEKQNAALVELMIWDITFYRNIIVEKKVPFKKLLNTSSKMFHRVPVNEDYKSGRITPAEFCSFAESLFLRGPTDRGFGWQHYFNLLKVAIQRGDPDNSTTTSLFHMVNLISKTYYRDRPADGESDSEEEEDENEDEDSAERKEKKEQFFCKNNHCLELRRSDPVDTDPAYATGAYCEVCQQNFSYNTEGGYHCTTCVFDLCMLCASKRTSCEGNTKQLPKHGVFLLRCCNNHPLWPVNWFDPFKSPGPQYLCAGCDRKYDRTVHNSSLSCMKCNHPARSKQFKNYHLCPWCVSKARCELQFQNEWRSNFEGYTCVPPAENIAYCVWEALTSASSAHIQKYMKLSINEKKIPDSLNRVKVPFNEEVARHLVMDSSITDKEILEFASINVSAVPSLFLSIASHAKAGVQNNRPELLSQIMKQHPSFFIEALSDELRDEIWKSLMIESLCPLLLKSFTQKFESCEVISKLFTQLGGFPEVDIVDNHGVHFTIKETGCLSLLFSILRCAYPSSFVLYSILHGFQSAPFLFFFHPDMGPVSDAVQRFRTQSGASEELNVLLMMARLDMKLYHVPWSPELRDLFDAVLLCPVAFPVQKDDEEKLVMPTPVRQLCGALLLWDVTFYRPLIAKKIALKSCLTFPDSCECRKADSHLRLPTDEDFVKDRINGEEFLDFCKLLIKFGKTIPNVLFFLLRTGMQQENTTMSLCYIIRQLSEFYVKKQKEEEEEESPKENCDDEKDEADIYEYDDEFQRVQKMYIPLDRTIGMLRSEISRQERDAIPMKFSNILFMTLQGLPRHFGVNFAADVAISLVEKKATDQQILTYLSILPEAANILFSCIAVNAFPEKKELLKKIATTYRTDFFPVCDEIAEIQLRCACAIPTKEEGYSSSTKSMMGHTQSYPVHTATLACCNLSCSMLKKVLEKFPTLLGKVNIETLVKQVESFHFLDFDLVNQVSFRYIYDYFKAPQYLDRILSRGINGFSFAKVKGMPPEETYMMIIETHEKEAIAAATPPINQSKNLMSQLIVAKYWKCVELLLPLLDDSDAATHKYTMMALRFGPLTTMSLCIQSFGKSEKLAKVVLLRHDLSDTDRLSLLKDIAARASAESKMKILCLALKCTSSAEMWREASGITDAMILSQEADKGMKDFLLACAGGGHCEWFRKYVGSAMLDNKMATQLVTAMCRGKYESMIQTLLEDFSGVLERIFLPDADAEEQTMDPLRFAALGGMEKLLKWLVPKMKVWQFLTVFAFALMRKQFHLFPLLFDCVEQLVLSCPRTLVSESKSLRCKNDHCLTLRSSGIGKCNYCHSTTTGGMECQTCHFDVCPKCQRTLLNGETPKSPREIDESGDWEDNDDDGFDAKETASIRLQSDLDYISTFIDTYFSREVTSIEEGITTYYYMQHILDCLGQPGVQAALVKEAGNKDPGFCTVYVQEKFSCGSRTRENVSLTATLKRSLDQWRGVMKTNESLRLKFLETIEQDPKTVQWLTLKAASFDDVGEVLLQLITGHSARSLDVWLNSLDIASFSTYNPGWLKKLLTFVPSEFPTLLMSTTNKEGAEKQQYEKAASIWAKVLNRIVVHCNSELLELFSRASASIGIDWLPKEQRSLFGFPMFVKKAASSGTVLGQFLSIVDISEAHLPKNIPRFSPSRWVQFQNMRKEELPENVSVNSIATSAEIQLHFEMFLLPTDSISRRCSVNVEHLSGLTHQQICDLYVPEDVLDIVFLLQSAFASAKAVKQAADVWPEYLNVHKLVKKVVKEYNSCITLRQGEDGATTLKVASSPQKGLVLTLNSSAKAVDTQIDPAIENILACHYSLKQISNNRFRCVLAGQKLLNKVCIDVANPPLVHLMQEDPTMTRLRTVFSILCNMLQVPIECEKNLSYVMDIPLEVSQTQSIITDPKNCYTIQLALVLGKKTSSDVGYRLHRAAPSSVRSDDHLILQIFIPTTMEEAKECLHALSLHDDRQLYSTVLPGMEEVLYPSTRFGRFFENRGIIKDGFCPHEKASGNAIRQHFEELLFGELPPKFKFTSCSIDSSELSDLTYQEVTDLVVPLKVKVILQDLASFYYLSGATRQIWHGWNKLGKNPSTTEWKDNEKIHRMLVEILKTCRNIKIQVKKEPGPAMLKFIPKKGLELTLNSSNEEEKVDIDPFVENVFESYLNLKKIRAIFYHRTLSRDVIPPILQGMVFEHKKLDVQISPQEALQLINEDPTGLRLNALTRLLLLYFDFTSFSSNYPVTKSMLSQAFLRCAGLRFVLNNLETKSVTNELIKTPGGNHTLELVCSSTSHQIIAKEENASQDLVSPIQIQVQIPQTVEQAKKFFQDMEMFRVEAIAKDFYPNFEEAKDLFFATRHVEEIQKQKRKKKREESRYKKSGFPLEELSF